MEERARFIEHKGARIFLLDFTDCGPELGMKIVADSAKKIRSQSEKSLCTLVVANGAKFNTSFANSLKDLAAGNEPYVVSSAIVGLVGLQSIVLNAVSMFSKRDFKVFSEVDEAKEYLAQAMGL